MSCNQKPRGKIKLSDIQEIKKDSNWTSRHENYNVWGKKIHWVESSAWWFYDTHYIHRASLQCGFFNAQWGVSST